MIEIIVNGETRQVTEGTTLDDLVEGRAVLWDITHEIATGHMGYELPVVG